jgi:hypothetical protein
MTDELKFPNPNERRVVREAGSIDEQTARAIHAAYMPPVIAGETEDNYWNALERKIMARIESAGPRLREQTWMSVLNGWAQVGLVAAAALFAIGSVISSNVGEPAEQVAYDSVVQVSAPEGVAATTELVNATDESSLHEAALRYVLSY